MRTQRQAEYGHILHTGSTGVTLPWTKNFRKLRERTGTDPSQNLPKGAWPCWFLDFRLMVSGTVRQDISVVEAPNFVVLCWAAPANKDSLLSLTPCCLFPLPSLPVTEMKGFWIKWVFYHGPLGIMVPGALPQGSMQSVIQWSYSVNQSQSNHSSLLVRRIWGVICKLFHLLPECLYVVRIYMSFHGVSISPIYHKNDKRKRYVILIRTNLNYGINYIINLSGCERGPRSGLSCQKHTSLSFASPSCQEALRVRFIFAIGWI